MISVEINKIKNAVSEEGRTLLGKHSMGNNPVSEPMNFSKHLVIPEAPIGDVICYLAIFCRVLLTPRVNKMKPASPLVRDDFCESSEGTSDLYTFPGQTEFSQKFSKIVSVKKFRFQNWSRRVQFRTLRPLRAAEAPASDINWWCEVGVSPTQVSFVSILLFPRSS